MINVLVSAYAPFNTLNIPLDGCTPLSSLPGLIARRTCASADHNNTSQQRLTLQSGATLPASGALSSLLSNGHHQNEVHLRLALKLPGGKGGFGSQLRAAGGRMSTRGREDNTDSCRDLSGRRLSSVKEAQRVAKLTESAEEHEARRKEIQAKRLEELQGQVKKLEGSNSGTKRRREEVQGQGDDEDKSEERRDKGKSAIMAGKLFLLFTALTLCAHCVSWFRSYDEEAQKGQRKQRRQEGGIVLLRGSARQAQRLL